MSMHSSIAEPLRLSRKEEIRRTVLQVVSYGSREGLAQLASVTEEEWRGLLRWLDVSGMALYFVDRLHELQQEELLPAPVLRRLEHNLSDNASRTQGMIAETAAINDAMQRAGLTFALLKGLSLTPDAVERPELRSQLDIDFLVAQADMTAAQRILEARGYYLHAISGRSCEFKTYAVPSRSLRDLYRHGPLRSVELHAEAATAKNESRLARRTMRVAAGMEIPVLCASDVFIGQGLHLFKHVSSAHYRASHLVEFHRHLRMRRDDENFWREVQARAAETGAAAWALGVATLLAERLLGEYAPESFTRWTVDELSGPVRLWVEMYGWRTALGSFPGNKLYVLLVRQLEKEGLEARSSASMPQPESEVNAELGSARGPLVPRRLPAMVVRGQAGESLRTRASRIRLQLWFILLRLRFHLVEGLRIFIESRHWKRRLKDLEEENSPAICAVNKGVTIR
jgi:hypothetical protein